MMNCDSIARVYRWIEYAAFGPLLQRTRLHWLEQLGGARRVLLLGDGDGRFLSRFASRYPSAEVHYIDSSARMLDLARKRIGGTALAEPGSDDLHPGQRAKHGTAGTAVRSRRFALFSGLLRRARTLTTGRPYWSDTWRHCHLGSLRFSRALARSHGSRCFASIYA